MGARSTKIGYRKGNVVGGIVWPIIDEGLWTWKGRSTRGAIAEIPRIRGRSTEGVLA